MGNPRRTNGTKRTKLREFVKRQGLPCALCGKPIDYSLHNRALMDAVQFALAGWGLYEWGKDKGTQERSCEKSGIPERR